MTASKVTWTLKTGWMIATGIVAIGLLLQLIVGPVDWHLFRWPVNGLVLAVLLTMLALMNLFSAKMHLFRFLTTFQAAIPALGYGVGLTIVMGLTRQEPGGQWFSDMLAFWPFVLIYVYIAVILGLIVLKRLRHLSSWVRDVPFLLNHLGLFLALVCATLGNADMQRLKMSAVVDAPEWRAIDSQQRIVSLPFSIELKRFIMETYADGSPKRFASDIMIGDKTGKRLSKTVDVNHPVTFDGWTIYQYSYDTQMEPLSQSSIFELVKDPWLPAVYAGIYMMLGGALCMFVLGRKRTVNPRKELKASVK